MPSRLWIRSPAWDTAFIALPWLPLALVLFACLDDPLALPAAGDTTLNLLVAGVLALDSGHRYYTFPIAYADRAVFRRHRRKLFIAPLVIGAVVLSIAYLEPLRVLSAYLATAIVIWTFWHTIMQRVGFLRIYGGKLGGALRETSAAKLDRAAVWSLVAFMLVIGAVALSDRAKDTPDARPFMQLVAPVVMRHAPWFATIVSLLTALAVGAWLRQEQRIAASWSERMPRAVFAASTAGLLLLPLASPLIGAACLKVSHAIEYIAFVHAYQGTKFRAQPTPGWFAALMLRPWLAVPALFAVFCVALQWLALPLYLAALIAPLHFLYDGWIWKLADKDVRAPLTT